MYGVSRFLVLLLVALPVVGQAKDIVRDAEYRILETQNGERWERDDAAIDAKLAELREQNGGKPPNIIYILLDDMGFGETRNAGHGRDARLQDPESRCDGPERAQPPTHVHRAFLHAHPCCDDDGTPSRPDRGRRSEDHALWRWTARGGGHPRGAASRCRLRHVSRGQVAPGRHRRGTSPTSRGSCTLEFPIHQQAQLGLMHTEAEQEDFTRGIVVFYFEKLYMTALRSGWVSGVTSFVLNTILRAAPKLCGQMCTKLKLDFYSPLNHWNNAKNYYKFNDSSKNTNDNQFFC